MIKQKKSGFPSIRKLLTREIPITVLFLTPKASIEKSNRYELKDCISKMTKLTILIFLILSAQATLGFTNPNGLVKNTAPGQLFADQYSHDQREKIGEVVNEPIQYFSSSTSVAGFFTGFVGFIGNGIAAADDYELAELPPPYVPAVFGVLLLAGVGVLTSSLGNVMDEEAGLGMQSGARAKKEIERSRSSYFGKRPK